MKKKLLIGAGVVAVSCIAVLGGILNSSSKVYAGGEIVYDRSPIFGFTASAGDVYLQMNRDNIETQSSKGSTSVILAQYTLSNGGPSNIELNAPAFYALADKPFILDNNVRNIVLSTDSDIPAVVSGNRIQFLDTVTVSPFSTITFYLMGDVSESAPVSSLVFEPDFTSPEFVINYADEMGNDGQLAPFNLVGDTQALKLSATGGLTDVFTASNVDYAKYYYSIKGTLTSPYIPEGAIMRNEAGIDVYIAKYKNNKRFKRLILSPSVFKSYGHLKWENVLIVNDAVMESYTTSDYVFVAGEDTIWRLDPQGDTGTKSKFLSSDFSVWEYDTDGVYEINTVDRNSYVQGPDILTVNINSAGLAMVSPNGGEKLVAGQTYIIRWKATDLDVVDLLLYKGNNCSTGISPDIQVCGYTVDVQPTIPTALAFKIPNTGSYDWTVPKNLPSGDDYRIAVQNYYNLPYISESKGAFTIINNSL